MWWEMHLSLINNRKGYAYFTQWHFICTTFDNIYNKINIKFNHNERVWLSAACFLFFWDRQNSWIKNKHVDIE